jgi:hypothetical protein
MPPQYIPVNTELNRVPAVQWLGHPPPLPVATSLSTH